MNNGAFGENFPYSNFHDLNMDWIIKIAKDFLDQYTHIQDTIDQGLEDLQTKADTLEGLLQAWYDTHSQDIANQLTNALADLATATTTAINNFNQSAEEKAQQTIASIPDDFTTLSNEVVFVRNALEGNNILSSMIMEYGFVQSSDGSLYQGGNVYKYTTLLPVQEGDRFFFNLYGSTSTVTVAGYADENSNAVLNKSIIGTSSQNKAVYTVPSGINYVRFTGNVNDPMFVFYLMDNPYTQTITSGDYDDFAPSSVPYSIITGNDYVHAPTRTAGTLYCLEDFTYNIRFQIFIQSNTANVHTRLRTGGVNWTQWVSTLDLINQLSIEIAGDNLIDMQSMSYGFVQSSDGSLYQGGSVYKYSPLIPVYPGQKFAFFGYGSSGTLKVAGYENDYSNAVIEKSLIGDSVNTNPVTSIYTVPEGIKYIRICATIYNENTLKLITDKELRKEIKILFIGNSLTQDGIAYLPYILHNYYPDVMFKFYIWYNGGYTLHDQYEKFIAGSNCETFSIANNTDVWYNQSNSLSIDNILSTYKFDIVCMQEYFNYKTEYTSADLTDWNNCQTYIQQHYTGGNPLEFITLFPAPKRDNATFVFNLTKTGIGSILKNTIAQDMIPMGISIYRAMSTSLDSLGDASHLSNDGTHAQEGLPCLIETYTVLCWLLEKLGINKSIYGDTLRMTGQAVGRLDVPGLNYGTGTIPGTDAQNILGQEVAIKAYKEGKQFTIYNLSDNN